MGTAASFIIPCHEEGGLIVVAEVLAGLSTEVGESWSADEGVWEELECRWEGAG